VRIAFDPAGGGLSCPAQRVRENGKTNLSGAARGGSGLRRRAVVVIAIPGQSYADKRKRVLAGIRGRYRRGEQLWRTTPGGVGSTEVRRKTKSAASGKMRASSISDLPLRKSKSQVPM